MEIFNKVKKIFGKKATDKDDEANKYSESSKVSKAFRLARVVIFAFFPITTTTVSQLFRFFKKKNDKLTDKPED